MHISFSAQVIKAACSSLHALSLPSLGLLTIPQTTDNYEVCPLQPLISLHVCSGLSDCSS